MRTMRRPAATSRSPPFAPRETGDVSLGDSPRSIRNIALTYGGEKQNAPPLDLCGMWMQDHFGPALVAVVEVLVRVGRFHQR
jgi:hypothetical protein